MIHFVHSAARTGSTLLCRHLANKFDAINFDEWLMEMLWTTDADAMRQYVALKVDASQKVPPYGWKPKELPKNMKPDEIKKLFWFMHEIEEKAVALKEKSEFVEHELSNHNIVFKMMSKNRDYYLKHLPHENIYNYRRDLLATACSWVIGVFGLLDNIKLGHMHWEKGEWEEKSIPIIKNDLTADEMLGPYLDILMSSHWVWFNKAREDRDAKFYVYEDWVDNQEDLFPDTLDIPTIRTPVHYTDVLSEGTIELIDNKIVDLKGAFKDHGFV